MRATADVRDSKQKQGQQTKYRIDKERCLVLGVANFRDRAKALIHVRKYHPGSSSMDFSGLSGEGNVVCFGVDSWKILMSQWREVTNDLLAYEAEAARLNQAL